MNDQGLQRKPLPSEEESLEYSTAVHTHTRDRV